MTGREELLQKIKDKECEVNELSNERYELMQEFLDKYEVLETKEQYLNKYFKYKNNHYSCPEDEKDYWNEYYYVYKITSKANIKAINFRKDNEGAIEIKKETMYINDNVVEITREEFLENWNIIKNDVTDLEKMFQ